MPLVVVALLWPPSSLAEVDASAEQHAPCPAGMVGIESAFCIDAFEAHLVGDEGRIHPFYVRPTEGGLRADSRRGLYPQAHINRNQAEVACRKAGKRLCRSEEWQRACRGKGPTPYPYGRKRRAGYCNDHAVAPLAVIFGHDRVEYGAHTMNDSRLNRVPGSLSRSGHFGRCTNAYGVFDMVGNLHEWVADASGVLRGGYYLDVESLGEGCAYRAVGHAPEYGDYATGFRCCADSP